MPWCHDQGPLKHQVLITYSSACKTSPNMGKPSYKGQRHRNVVNPEALLQLACMSTACKYFQTIQNITAPKSVELGLCTGESPLQNCSRSQYKTCRHRAYIACCNCDASNAATDITTVANSSCNIIQMLPATRALSAMHGAHHCMQSLRTWFGKLQMCSGLH